MLNVSAGFKTRIDDYSREITVKVEFYFDGDTSPSTIFYPDTKLSYLGLLEECFADVGGPLGAVSSNELLIKVSNEGKLFTPTNLNGPYYGKLVPGKLVKPFIGIKLINGTFEYVPLGVFRTSDWNAPSQEIEASVQCYDRLFELGNKEMPKLHVFQSTQLKDVFDRVFKSLGLSSGEFDIDSTLRQVIKYTWFEGKKVKDVLQELAEGGFCSVFCDRYGKIKVRNNLRVLSSVATLTDDDQIIACVTPKRQDSIYSIAKIEYNNPALQEEVEVVGKIDDITIQPGLSSPLTLNFSSIPVGIIRQVNILNGANTKIYDLQFGGREATIRVLNSGTSAETISIIAQGNVIESYVLSYEILNEEQISLIGEKTMTVSNHLMQDLSSVKNYATIYLNLVSSDQVEVEAAVRGNPALELYDTIHINDVSDDVTDLDVVITRIELEYDGGLQGRIRGIKAEALKVKDWCPVGMGLYALCSRTII